MVYSTLKRILSLEKTMKILHSSSSSTSIEDRESQMVQVTCVKFTRADDDPSSSCVKNNFSKNGTTTTALPTSSSSFTRTRPRSNCQDRIWMTCAIVTVLLLVLLVTIFLTFLTLSPYNDDLNSSDDSSSQKEYPVPLINEQHSNHNNNDSNEASSNLSSEMLNKIDSGNLNSYNNKRNGQVVPSGGGGEVNYNSNNYGHGSDRGSNSRPKQNGYDLKTVSRLSWELLNRKSTTSKPNTHFSNKNANSGDRRTVIGNLKDTHSVSSTSSQQLEQQQSPVVKRLEQGEIILPSVMVYTSRGSSTNGEINNLRNVQNNGGQGEAKGSCCSTQKYKQTVTVDGCEPLTVVNRMCFGHCVSVWVPGFFASFPVCKPSRSTWKGVTLTCGPQRDRKKRVKIEKVRRCSCMELK